MQCDVIGVVQLLLSAPFEPTPHSKHCRTHYCLGWSKHSDHTIRKQKPGQAAPSYPLCTENAWDEGSMMKHLMLSHTLFTHRIVDTQKSIFQHSNLKEYDQRSTLWIFIQILLRNSVANIHSTYTNKFVTALKNIMQIKGNWRTSF